MSGFSAMGGYAGYLLVAYGVTALVVIGNIIAARRQFRRTQLRLSEQLARRAGRRQGAGPALAAKDGNEATTFGRTS